MSRRLTVKELDALIEAAAFRLAGDFEEEHRRFIAPLETAKAKLNAMLDTRQRRNKP